MLLLYSAMFATKHLIKQTRWKFTCSSILEIDLINVPFAPLVLANEVNTIIYITTWILHLILLEKLTSPIFKGNLRQHINRVHSIPKVEERVYECAECSCVFKKLCSLNAHKNRVHQKLYVNIDYWLFPFIIFSLLFSRLFCSIINTQQSLFLILFLTLITKSVYYWIAIILKLLTFLVSVCYRINFSFLFPQNGTDKKSPSATEKSISIENGLDGKYKLTIVTY